MRGYTSLQVSPNSGRSGVSLVAMSSPFRSPIALNVAIAGSWTEATGWVQPQQTAAARRFRVSAGFRVEPPLRLQLQTGLEKWRARAYPPCARRVRRPPRALWRVWRIERPAGSGPSRSRPALKRIDRVPTRLASAPRPPSARRSAAASPPAPPGPWPRLVCRHRQRSTRPLHELRRAASFSGHGQR